MAFIGLDRGIVDHWIYQDAEYFKVWFEMLYRARYSTDPHSELIEGEIVTVNYGEFIFGRIKWSSRLKVSEQRLRTLIKKLKAEEMIEVVSEHRKCTLYRIKNYAKFNQQSNQQPAQSQQEVSGFDNQQSNQHLTSSQPAANQQLTTKEQGSNKDNNENKEKKDKREYADYVFLTETEYDKLTTLLGENGRDSYFVRYGSWISGQPKKIQNSRSAYLSILNWHREDKKKEANKVAEFRTSTKGIRPGSYQKASGDDSILQGRTGWIGNKGYDTDLSDLQ